MAIRRIEKVSKTLLCFMAGALLGVLLGTAPGSLAGFGLKAWKGNSRYVQAGYISGFTDAVRVSRANNPASYLASEYPLPSRGLPRDWKKEIDALYDDPKYADYPVSSLMSIAAKSLVARYGPLSSSGPSGLARLGELLSHKRNPGLQGADQRSEAGSEATAAAQEAARRKQEDADHRRLAKSIGVTTLDWGRMTSRERLGYVEGFNHCVSISQYTGPDSYLSRAYTSPRSIDASLWKRTMDSVHAKNKIQPPAILMAWVGRDLAENNRAAKSLEPNTLLRYRKELDRLLQNHDKHTMVKKKAND